MQELGEKRNPYVYSFIRTAPRNCCQCRPYYNALSYAETCIYAMASSHALPDFNADFFTLLH